VKAGSLSNRETEGTKITIKKRIKMAEVIQKVERLRYKTLEILKLTRGITSDITELIGDTPLVRRR